MSHEDSQVAEKCLETFARKRFRSLQHLREQCQQYGAERPWHLSDSERIGWAMIEEAFGWMDLGRFDEAAMRLDDARGYAHRLEILHWALDNVQAGRGLCDEVERTENVEVRVPQSSPIAVKQWLEVLRPRGNEVVAGEILDGAPQARALVGKAGLLLDAGALESALSLFDVVCAEAPSDLDASEGRAQALERLGRLGEAAAEYRRFVGLANARADLRVRAAQQWLDAHAL